MSIPTVGRRAACCVAALLFLAGCGRSVPPPKTDGGVGPAGEDPLDLARNAVQRAATPAAYHDAIDPLADYAAERVKPLERHWPNAKDRPLLLQALAGVKGVDAEKLDERGLLRALWVHRLGLDADEVTYVESPRFARLDGHHLDYCVRLRDAARSLQLQAPGGLKDEDAAAVKLEQARAAFGWAVRQVALSFTAAELEPPSFALREGRGGPRERALVFLGVLAQLDLDGCIVAVPDKGGQGQRHLLAGVLIPEKSAVYLFDPRLGLPVPGPGGSGVATLAEFRERPEVVQQLSLPGSPYDITPEQAKQARVMLAFPLTALAPRMGFLEEVLAVRERVVVSLRPERVLARFAQAGFKDVGIWNEPGTGKAPGPRTPTRVLRLSLPPGEGGVGSPLLYLQHHKRLIPLSPSFAGFSDMNLQLEELGKAAGEKLEQVVSLLHEQFVLLPREEVARGKVEEASARLVRGQRLVEEYATARGSEAEFAKSLIEWGKQARAVALDLTRTGNKAAFDAFWVEDQFLISVVRGEEVERHKLKKGTLGAIVFRAVGDQLRAELSYLQALRWHEKAERVQSRIDVLTRIKAGGAAGLREQAHDAWANAVHNWEKFAHENPLTAGALSRSVQGIHALRARGERVLAVGVTDSMMRAIRVGLQARRLHALALEGDGKDRAAASALRALLSQIDAVTKNADLKKLREAILADVPQEGRETAERVLFGDLGAGGALEWLRHAARLDLRRMTGKAE